MIELRGYEGTADDYRSIATILRSRPESQHAAWKAPVNAIWTLAYDDAGVCAFMVALIDEGGIVVHQIEGLCEGGLPSVRGRRGLAALERALHALADSEGRVVYSVVNESNARHLTALEAREYVRVPVVVLKRMPKGGKRVMMSRLSEPASVPNVVLTLGESPT